MKPVDITSATFEEMVLKAPIPVFVDFWAPWCGPCKMVAPIVEELANEYEGRVRFVKVNTDEHGDVAARYGIRGIPTLMLFNAGLEAARWVGYRSKADFKQKLDELVAKPA